MTSLQAVRVIETPIGNIAIGSTELGVSNVEILPPEKVRSEFTESKAASRHSDSAARQLLEYFSGGRTEFDLDYDLHGTAFQKAVWNQITQIGFSESMSYGDIAAALGKPAAYRAVGGAVGANPVPLLIGCHRVLGSNRKLTGYTGGQGLKTKLWLLDHERVEYR